MKSIRSIYIKIIQRCSWSCEWSYWSNKPVRSGNVWSITVCWTVVWSLYTFLECVFVVWHNCSSLWRCLRSVDRSFIINFITNQAAFLWRRCLGSIEQHQLHTGRFNATWSWACEHDPVQVSGWLNLCTYISLHCCLTERCRMYIHG